MRRLAVILATAFGIGRLPIAPATWASLATAVALSLFRLPLDLMILGAIVVVLTPVAVLASGEAERELGHDAGPIVIDEVVGMLVGALGTTAWRSSSPVLPLAFLFIYFRIFDIWKPFPVHQLQALPGGLGVVADDVAAGLLSAGALALTGLGLHAIAPALVGGAQP